MADLSKIRLNNTNYNLKDKQVRDFLEKGWIPAGMEYVDFYDSENQTYLVSYSQCQILCWKQNEGTEENPVYKKILFYSTGENADGKYFHALDGKSLSYHPREARWYYHDPETGTDTTSWSEDFPEIQYGYKFPNGVYHTSISNINTSSILCAEDSPSFLYNKMMSGIQVIATIEFSGYNYSYAPLIHSTDTSAYFFMVNANEYELIEITNTQIPDSNQVPSDLRNKYECNSINFHEPEDDEDVDDMLESLDLTVIDDDNLVGSAEIGSGNVVDWSTPKQTKGGVYIVPMTIIEHYAPEVPHDYTEGALGATWQDIFDNLINNGKQIFFYNESDNSYAALSGIGQDSDNHYYVFTANVQYDFFTDAPNGYPQFTMS